MKFRTPPTPLSSPSCHHQPALAGATGINVVGSSEHKTPGSSWPINPSNCYQHSRWLAQDASRSWASTLSGLALGRGSELFKGHTDHLVAADIHLVMFKEGQTSTGLSSICFAHNRHFHTSYPKLPFILSTQTFPPLAQWSSPVSQLVSLGSSLSYLVKSICL